MKIPILGIFLLFANNAQAISLEAYLKEIGYKGDKNPLILPERLQGGYVLRLENKGLTNIKGIQDIYVRLKSYVNKGNHIVAILDLTPMLLSKVPYLIIDISKNELKKIPKKIDQLVNVIGLSLSNNKLDALPDLSALEKLRVLHFENNNFTKLPKTIGSLKLLEVLVCEANKIQEIPAGILQLPHLRELYISHNKLDTLPDLSTLEELKVLEVENNALVHLPTTIGNLKMLEVLACGSNKIQEIPASILQLPNLQELYVDKNDLKGELPLLGMKNLRVLDIENNPSLDKEYLKSHIKELKKLYPKIECYW